MIAKGQKISDRYEIIKSVGEGGMANVYLAYDTILERNVAVKILRGDLATDEKFVRRFQREALQASSLSHENIVEVYDVGEDNGDYYIVMEYVQGKHLKELLKKRGKLTASEVIDIMLQVTSGLSVAHDAYVIHRDIKPQNIMILENGLVKLADFGIAVAMNSTQLTQTNSVMGSVHYLPPEQASGTGATLQSDIYSLGILMYELLTGKLPFKGDNAVEIALKQLKDPMPSIREELPDVPVSIENIIIRATAKNPKNRYADAREMHEDLKTCLEDARKKEIPITLQYPENNYDGNKVYKGKKETLTKKESEEVIAKKITQNDARDQNKLTIILLSIFTGLIVIITAIVVLLPQITNTKKVTVPNVNNMTYAEAVKKLKEKGFEISEKIDDFSSKVEEGSVIKTSPSSGTTRKKGSEIKVYVSAGSNEITIEDYTNQKADYIRGKLEGFGVKVLIETKDVENADNKDKLEEGIIIEQSVAAGEKLTSGDTITLYTPNTSVYPNFADGKYTVTSILEYAEEKGINVTFKNQKNEKIDITLDNSQEYDNETISGQSRPEGTKAVSGASLTIYLESDSTGSDSANALD